MARGVASGMTYLSDLGYIHRVKLHFFWKISAKFVLKLLILFLFNALYQKIFETFGFINSINPVILVLLSQGEVM